MDTINGYFVRYSSDVVCGQPPLIHYHRISFVNDLNLHSEVINTVPILDVSLDFSKFNHFFINSLNNVSLVFVLHGNAT